MTNKAGDNQPDVFEMILQTVGDDFRAVATKSADFVLPENWHTEHQDGQLAVDVAQTDKEVIIVSTMAGALVDKIAVYLHNDLLTIRGERLSPFSHIGQVEFFHQECFWGKFSRTVVLPVDVKSDLAQAEYRNGILTIRIPKQRIDTQIPVFIVDE